MAPDGSAMAPDGSGEGNNKSPRISASCNWCFTYYPDDESDIGSFENELKKVGNYIFGEEICPTSSRLHLQGYIEFHKKTRPTENPVFKHCRWAKRARKATRLDNVKYCTKIQEDTGKRPIVHTNTDWEPEELIDPLEGKVLHPFQKRVIEMINDKCNDDRVIHWFWDKRGNRGKTALCKHICIKYKSIYLNGKSADVKCGIAKLIETTGKAPKIMLFGYPRSSEEYVNYGSLEEVKDGLFFSGKFESGMVKYNSPHVFVFANFKPDKTKMSKDRWQIHDIGEGLEEEAEEGSDHELRDTDTYNDNYLSD